MDMDFWEFIKDQNNRTVIDWICTHLGHLIEALAAAVGIVVAFLVKQGAYAIWHIIMSIISGIYTVAKDVISGIYKVVSGSRAAGSL